VIPHAARVRRGFAERDAFQHVEQVAIQTIAAPDALALLHAAEVQRGLAEPDEPLHEAPDARLPPAD
jgi:hypothetical protein